MGINVAKNLARQALLVDVLTLSAILKPPLSQLTLGTKCTVKFGRQQHCGQLAGIGKFFSNSTHVLYNTCKYKCIVANYFTLLLLSTQFCINFGLHLATGSKEEMKAVDDQFITGDLSFSDNSPPPAEQHPLVLHQSALSPQTGQPKTSVGGKSHTYTDM